MSSMSILSSSIIPRFCNLFIYLITSLVILNKSTPLMLPNVEFVTIYAFVWAFRAQSISKPFELAMHLLCKHMQVITKSNMWPNGMFTFLNKILNLPFNIPKVLWINIIVLD
jgi:hypothetical protein